ncbi:MAG: FkbM family methyltransferase [Chitinophagaceae bacterium]|nr:FkbM family methyltransferase [Chitinophagaceae bacterium]
MSSFSYSFGSVLRSLPQFRGKHRLSRWVLKNLVSTGHDLRVKGLLGCEYLLPNLTENLAFDVFINGIYEKETNDFLVEHIPQNAIVLDIGANIGTICIPLAKRRKDIRVYCVEASPFVFEYLKTNVELNGLTDQIFCHNLAITDQDGAQLPFYSDPEKFGKGSLAPIFADVAVMVNGMSLDSFVNFLKLPRVDFIKIDIEGYEYAAFKGGHTILSSPVAPSILFEFVDWAEEFSKVAKGSAQKILSDYGYSLLEFDEKNGLISLPKILTTGSAMLVARKKS